MKRVFKLHPVLFATMPTLALFAENINQLVFPQIIRSLIVSILASIFIYLILWSLSRDWEQAALLTSLFLILFSNYGHVYTSLGFQLNHLRENQNLNLDLNQLVFMSRMILMPIWITVAVAGVLLIKRSVKWRPQMTQFFFLLGIGSIILPSITIIKNREALLLRSVDTMTISPPTITRKWLLHQSRTSTTLSLMVMDVKT